MVKKNILWSCIFFSLMLACQHGNANESVLKTFRSADIEVEVTSWHSEKPSYFCSDFRLSSTQIKEYLNNAKEISSKERNNDYDYFGCTVSCTLISDKRNGKLTIDAGGTGTLIDSNGTVIFLSCDTCDELFDSK